MYVAARIKPTIIVVAAGQGSRFDAQAKVNAAGIDPSIHKLDQALLTAGDSLDDKTANSVLGQTLLKALVSQLPVLAVIRKERLPQVAPLLAQKDILLLPEADANKGMGASIAAGVHERCAASGWLVVPGDMPLIRPESMLAVALALEHHAVAYAQFQGHRGHPVGFSAELYSELIALDGDDGAKRLLSRYPAYAVDVADGGVLVDVDTPQALQTARHMVRHMVRETAAAMDSQSA